ncbi:HAD family hydrolase [Halomarina ordinaria]|uniref:HAD family hydrolase n=1 Tax=Halomarina ordinaria TaxID=3033939 RepID=A0ABD5U734_9EURY|nr:HAD family hydrolase [Halomarina sp. PSRA2]
MSYEAVVFDNDGVLVELPSRDAFRRAAERTFKRFGLRRPTRDDVRALVAGNPERIRELCRTYRIDALEFCYEAAANAVREQKRELEAGVRRLYDDVHAVWTLDVPFGLVSNNQHEAVAAVLRFFGLEDRFDAVYGCPFTPTGLGRMKPDPYYLDRALADLETRDALYVGDSACDVEAAANAGIDSALLTREGSVDPAVEPTHEIPNLGALPGLVRA